MKDIIKMQRLAGIITEGQARKMMEVLGEETFIPGVSLTPLQQYLYDYDVQINGKEVADKFLPFIKKNYNKMQDFSPSEYYKERYADYPQNFVFFWDKLRKYMNRKIKNKADYEKYYGKD